MSDPRRQRALAAFAAVGVVGVVLAYAASRQDEDAAAADLAYYGEEWDVARQCLVGTPIGRRDGAARIAEQLEAKAYAALAELEGGADPEATWPLACLGRVGRLRPAPDLASDPGPALSSLELQLARALAAPLDAAEVPTRMRDLAAPIAILDAALPAGATYDPARYPAVDPGAGRAAIHDSHACDPPRVARRPFLHAEAGGEPLHDERARGDVSERLLGDAERRLARSGPDLDEERALEATDLRLPRFFDDGHLAWLTVGDPPALVVQDLVTGARDPARPLPVPRAEAWASRGSSHVLAAGDEAWLVFTDALDVAHPLAPAPPAEGVVWASRPGTAALAWFTGDGWEGVRCTPHCTPLPPLAAAGDVQLEVAGGRVLAVGRGPRTGLTYAWRATADGTWSAPTPMARGRLSASEEGFQVSYCGGRVTSPDGESWAAD